MLGGLSQLASAASESRSSSILVLGDSLSAAYNLPSESGWVALVDRKAKDAGYGLNFVNASISGATTAAGLQLLPSLLSEHQPRIVILELGANDGLQGKPLGYIRQNLVRLIQLSKSSGSEVLLLGIRIPPNFGDAYALPFFAQYAELSEEYDTALVPFLLEGVAGNRALMMEDGLHPRAAGQVIISDTVWQVLEPLLKPLLNP